MYGQQISHDYRISDGYRVKHPGRPEIYLMDKGRRRLIVNANVHNGIFRSWERIVAADLQSIPQGPPIVEGTILFRYPNSNRVYLYDKENGRRWVKRPILSSNAFNRYHFDWNKIRQYSRSFNPPVGSQIV